MPHYRCIVNLGGSDTNTESFSASVSDIKTMAKIVRARYENHRGFVIRELWVLTKDE